MTGQITRIRWNVVLITVIVVGILFAAGMARVRIDADILSSLPRDDRVLKDASYIFRHHPIQDQIAIDISIGAGDPDKLADLGDAAESILAKSGLFESVGTADMQRLFPIIISHVQDSLPILFSREDLEKKAAPLLERSTIEQTLGERLASLSNLQGIGQGMMIAGDPLGIAGIVFARLAHLAPGGNATLYRGHLISADGRSLLIIARPKHSATDTAFARSMTETIERMTREIQSAAGIDVAVTPVGAYRAALDNEEMAKRDVELALTISTIGIALLLIFSFPRPLFGLLSLLPAMVGTVGSLFIYSLYNDTISILALGFGGAVISITVDHGIAFLLFLDQDRVTTGHEAAREVWTSGLFATLTTVGAFMALFFSGFEILSQIGQFTAIGHAVSFIFAHSVFPLAFPAVAPAKKRRVLPVRAVTEWIGSSKSIRKTVIALLILAASFFLAKPEFRIDLAEMNSVTRETLAAEKTVTDHWGAIFNRVFLLVEGKTAAQVQDKGDRLCMMFREDESRGALESFFNASLIYPGGALASQNARAWADFWSGRRERVKRDIAAAGRELGFAPGAFTPFFKTIAKNGAPSSPVPAQAAPLLGVTAKDGKFMQISTILPGAAYRAEEFYGRYSSMGRIFDPRYFSQRLSETLSSTFIWMITILGIGAALLLFIFYVDAVLTVVSILPVVFAFTCTLATLKLMGRPLDIPSLMISIIILGMGIDYTLYIVKSYQRNGRQSRAPIELINLAVFLAAVSTMIGFGSMILAQHTLLRSVGITSMLGIVYSIAGAYTILPPVMKRLFPPIEDAPAGLAAGSREHFRRVMNRFRHLEANPRLFAYFKMKTDSMFPELAGLVKDPAVIIDIGTGYGVPALWLLELYPRARVYGIEPDAERARFARMMLGERGDVRCGAAPDLPAFEGTADTALLLDMVHYLDDGELRKTLRGLHDRLRKGGRIILRTTIPCRKRNFMRFFEETRLKLVRMRPAYRSADVIVRHLERCGFTGITVSPSGKQREEFWFTAGA